MSAGDGREIVHVAVRAGSREAVEEKLRAADFVEEAGWKGEVEGDLQSWAISGAAGGRLSEKLFALAVESGWSLAELRPETVNLEAVFRRLTRGDDE